MTRKITLISEDENLIKFIEISALTLTKLNHNVNIIREFDENADLIIIDFDSTRSSNYLKSYRNKNQIRRKNILGLYTSEENIKRDELFAQGCNSVMSKSDFEKVGNNILVI